MKLNYWAGLVNPRLIINLYDEAGKAITSLRAAEADYSLYATREIKSFQMSQHKPLARVVLRAVS